MNKGTPLAPPATVLPSRSMRPSNGRCPPDLSANLYRAANQPPLRPIILICIGLACIGLACIGLQPDPAPGCLGGQTIGLAKETCTSICPLCPIYAAKSPCVASCPCCTLDKTTSPSKGARRTVSPRDLADKSTWIRAVSRVIWAATCCSANWARAFSRWPGIVAGPGYWFALDQRLRAKSPLRPIIDGGAPALRRGRV